MEVRELDVLAWRLFEESNDAVFVLDLNSETATIWQANPAAQRLTGLRWRQLRGRRLDELIRSDHVSQMTKLYSAVEETGFFHSQEEYLLLRDQLESLPINISVSRVHAPSGQLGLVVARDVSDRKRAEHAQREFSDELQRQVFVRTEELRGANQQLMMEVEERMCAEHALQETNQRLQEAIGQITRAQEHAIRRERLHALEQIAGGIAHDINNSLSAVTAFSELILGNELDNQTRQWAESVQTAAQDITGIVGRLRQFYGEPQDRETSERIDLVHLAKEVVHLTSPKWHDESLRLGKEIAVTVSAETALCIIGDSSAVRSVLINLVFNAVDAIDLAGRITIRIAAQSVMAVLEIVDNGIGMTNDVQIRCLEPFYTTKTEGTGLGLSVCHGIVKRHGGRIEIDSTPGEGTTIRLLIPKAPLGPMTSAEDSEPASTESLLVGRRILYVDDHLEARTSIAALLGSFGLVVDTAHDGPGGLVMFREKAYDAVVTDMSMPGMNGLQLTEAIKLLQPTMPVVIISGWPPSAARGETGIAQPDSVLSKPFTSDQLTATLVQLLPTRQPLAPPHEA